MDILLTRKMEGDGNHSINYPWFGRICAYILRSVCTENASFFEFVLLVFNELGNFHCLKMVKDKKIAVKKLKIIEKIKT